MTLRRFFRIFLLCFAAIATVAFLVLALAWSYFNPSLTRTNGIVYGQRHDQDLTLDVIKPAQPNGKGVVFLVSGGWKSGRQGSFDTWILAPLIRGGYTVFAVYHVSQPKATVMEIVDDVNRAVRFIRTHATEHGVAPDRLGVTGGSAGGHLSLMLATRGGPGRPDAENPVDRASSAVQAVAIFFPVTDLLNLGESTENLGDGGPPKSFVKAFGPQSTNLPIWKEIGREMSPIYHVKTNLPPMLIYHGDADTLVPLDQSERFAEKVREVGGTLELVVHRGGGHGWKTMIWDLRQFVAWFDRHLTGD